MEPPAPGELLAKDRSGGIARVLREIDARAIDALIALVLTAAAIVVVTGRTTDASIFREDDLLGTALVVAQTLPIAVRRVAPLGVLVAIGVALVAHSVIGYEAVQAGTFSSLLAVYGAASLTDNRRGLIAAAVTAVAITGFFATHRGDWGVSDFVAVSGTWAVVWFAGTFIRLRGEQVEVVGARATRLEIERDTLAQEAVADERARMARELHDIVGHALNVIVIQAAGAQRVFDAKPEVPREALASIESTGREALVEMERMLGVLGATNTPVAASRPHPGLAQLQGLAAHVSQAGLPVDLVIEGTPPPEIPASLELSAYRIAQESLTNCLKHASASHATVTVRYEPNHLEVEVADNGSGSAQRQADYKGGRGHVGMRERVALFGGEISIGPSPSGGGYRVRARLPFKSPLA